MENRWGKGEPTAVKAAGGVAVMRNLYYHVLRIRLVEEKIADLYPEQEIRCPVHLCIGQEAVAAGVCLALTKEDAVLSGHRAHGHYLAKGGNLAAMLAELYGRETGCCRGRGGSMHLIDLLVNFLGSTPIVASSIPVATGVAWAYQLRGERRVVVSFMGEAACEEGVWHESLNFAALHKLPIIYVCENNLYSVYTPLKERQPARGLAGLAAAHGLKTFAGDGNDALEVYKMALAARQYALSGAGPVFVELTTYRMGAHCVPNLDNDLGYRTEAEFQEWQERDPVLRLEEQLRAAGVNFEMARVREKIIREISEA